MAQTSLLSTGSRFSTLPESYIRPESERPRLSEVVPLKVPLIDLDSSKDTEEIIRQIGHACRDFGLFQVTNHGISTESIQKMFAVAREFFHMPVEEKMRYYSDDPSKKMRLSTSFNVKKEKVHNWRDYLRLHCYPLEEFVNDWPTTPQSFKDVVSNYCREVRGLGFKLLGAISETLGIGRDSIEIESQLKSNNEQRADTVQVLEGLLATERIARAEGNRRAEELSLQLQSTQRKLVVQQELKSVRLIETALDTKLRTASQRKRVRVDDYMGVESDQDMDADEQITRGKKRSRSTTSPLKMNAEDGGSVFKGDGEDNHSVQTEPEDYSKLTVQKLKQELTKHGFGAQVLQLRSPRKKDFIALYEKHVLHRLTSVQCVQGMCTLVI